jgi:hypothetical protein
MKLTPSSVRSVSLQNIKINTVDANIDGARAYNQRKRHRYSPTAGAASMAVGSLQYLCK